MMDTSSSSKPNGSLGWLEIRHRVSDSEMQELESCVANLYETISSKVTATRMILESAKRIDCLAHLAYHASAMCALARVLREEGHKSFDLRLNIISVIFITSFFQNFHKILLEQNIGRTTIQFLMFEIENMEYHHNLSNTSRVTSLHSKETMAWKSEKERVMYMSINVLFNLAEDINIQRKMKKYNLVELLCQVLDIRDLRLQLITAKFLKKLSIFEEDKNTMKENGVIFKLASLLVCQDSSLLFTILGLLWNLSFDTNLRIEMVECQFTAILGSLVCHKKLRHLVFGLLYNLSRDKNLLLQFENIGGIMGTMVKIIFEERSWHATKEVIALLVNLTSVPSFCEHIYEPMLVGKLLACAKDSSNPSLFKVMRNLSRFEVGTSLLSGFIPELVNALMDAQPSIQVEVMGILNNIASIKDMCCSILTRKHLLQFLSAQLGLNTTEDDLVLEIGIFIGSICSSKTASVISEARLVSSMCLLFPKKQYDKDLTVQFLYAFNQLLLYESTSKDFRACPDKMVMHVLKLRQDANKLVANMADMFMNVLMEIDQEWCIKIKWFNFSLISRMTFQGTI